MKQLILAKDARVLFSIAMKKGELTREPCETCGDPESHGHHDDYAKPYDVRWLCSKHHGQWHGENGFWNPETNSWIKPKPSPIETKQKRGPKGTGKMTVQIRMLPTTRIALAKRADQTDQSMSEVAETILIKELAEK